MSDASTRQLVDLFKMFRDLENPPNTQQLATYKMRAEQEYLEPNESIFAFVFVSCGTYSVGVIILIAVCRILVNGC